MMKRIDQISEQAFLLDFGVDINIKLNQTVIAFANQIEKKIKKNNNLGIKNCVPSYNKILIQFDPLLNQKKEIINFLQTINKKKLNNPSINKHIEIPICYEDEFALDIKEIVKKTKLSKQKIINIHLKTNFYVYMIGFMPGLPYLGDLDKKIFLPRKSIPRTNVPAGSIGIVENFCVIYPNESPGGWNIIGRTPKKLFYKNKKNPTFLKAGNFVKFRSISKKEFEKKRDLNEI